MINFTRLIGPHGIPIYHQQLPEIVQSVGVDWLILTGAADDYSAGADGAYHWFEHVPFRGTKRFPGGYPATKGQFTRYGGNCGAWTNLEGTNYWAEVLREQWKLALDVTTDLWSQPLLADEAIEAERQIIFEEIRQQNSTASGKAFYQLNNLLWNGHPYGHHTLGSTASLNSLTPEMLRTAHKRGYDRSRAVLFVSGNVSAEEVLDYVEKIVGVTPDNGLPERRQSAWQGTFPAWETGVSTIESEFASSVVLILFPIPEKRTLREMMLWQFIDDLMTLGGLNSPLYRIVREERKLAYQTGTTYRFCPGGGFWGFKTLTNREKISALVDAIKDVLVDDKLRSVDRIQEVKDGIRCASRMRAINPGNFNDLGINSLLALGKVVSDDEVDAIMDSFTTDEVHAALDRLKFDEARTIIFKGMSKA